MNRRGQHVSLKAAVCLLLCILAVGWICTAAQAEELAASAPVEKTNTLIIAPLRNKAYEETDADNTVIDELFYALHILRYSGTPLSLVPLLDSTQGPAAATPIEDISAQDTDQYKENFTGSISSIKDMGTTIDQTLNQVIELANQSDRHAFVIMILARVYSPTWEKLSELLLNTDADVLLIYLDNNSSSNDIDSLFQTLGVDKNDIEQKLNALITLTPRVRFMVVDNDHHASSYEALEPVLLGVSQQAQLPLIGSKTESNVTLPELGINNVMLVLKNIPEDYDVQITDPNGNIVTPVQQYRDFSGRRILELSDVGGKLTLTAYSAASAQPPGTDAADTLTPVPTDGATPSALPADGAEATVLPTVSPALATQDAATTGVEGTILFDFQCEDTALLSTQDGQPSYPKKTPVVFSVQPQGDILQSVLQTYPNVSMHLYVTGPDAVQKSYSLGTGNGQTGFEGQFTPEKAGIYTVEAELKIGDFYSVKSNSIMIDIMNQAPVIVDTSVAEFWIDNPYQPAEPITMDLAPMFSDPDLDSLEYLVSSDANGDFQTDWTDDAFAQFSIQEYTLTITPLVKAGSRSIAIKALDEDGGFAVSIVQITLHSIYQALAGVSIDGPTNISGSVAKNAAVTIATYPQFPTEPSDQGEIAAAFIKNASVTCNLQPADGGNPLSLPMTYHEESGTYQTVYTMPDTAIQYSVSVTFELSPPEGDTQHTAVSGTTNSIPLGSENTAPKWIASGTDLGTQWMADDGNGEAYDLTLDFASLFSDAEDAMPDMESHLTLYLSVRDSGGRAYVFSETADGAYLLTKHGNSTSADTTLRLPNASSVVLRFHNDGRYILHLIAEDPDGQKAQDELTLQLQSPTVSLYCIIGLAFVALVLLLGLCLLIARLLKPTFGEQALQVSLRTQTVTMTWSVPLEAWRKRNVPLRWIFLYGCVPPIPSLEPIASAVTIKPKRDGIAIITRNDTLQWVSGGEPLPRKFIQTESQPPVILKDADIMLELSLQNVSQRLMK